MAHFRGYVQGVRGLASRLGSKDSGLVTDAESWEGRVSVHLWHDDEAGVDMADVSLEPHHGTGESRTLYRGPVGGVTVRPHVKRKA